MAGANLAISFLEGKGLTKFLATFMSNAYQKRDLTAEPVLPGYRRSPKRIDDGSQQYKYTDAKSMHRQQ